MKRNLLLLASIAAISCGIGSVNAGTVSYSTGFENPPFSTGSINGQDGWSVTNPNFVQSVTTAAALNGSQSWLRSNNYSTGGFGDQSLSAPLPGGVKVGESSAVGVTPGSNTESYSVWFRAADTSAADGSFVQLSLTDANGDRMNYAGISNTAAGGLTLNAYDATSNGFGNSATFNAYSLTPTPLNRSTWHELQVNTTFVDGTNNDVVQYFVDNILVATTGSWEEYYRNDPEQLGNGNKLFGADRVGFYTRADPASFGFSDASAQGFYFDDFAESASVVPLPSAAWGGLALLGCLGLKGRMKRVHR